MLLNINIQEGNYLTFNNTYYIFSIHEDIILSNIT